MLDGWVYHATYKGVFMEFALGEKDEQQSQPWISIYMMISGNPRKGECQEMIDLIKKDFPDRKLCASVPMNEIAKHIFDKKGVEYWEE